MTDNPVRKPKATKAEVAERIVKIVELLTMGLKPGEIVRYVAKNTTWEIKQRQVENYIHEATEQIKQSAKIDRDYEIGKAKGRLEALYKSNLTIQDYKAALAVLKERNIMLGLNAPTKVAGTVTTLTWREFVESQTAGQSETDDDGSDPDAETDGE